MTTEENIALRRRFELLKGAEHHKNALIEELLRRVDQLTEDYNQEKLDHARESHFNRDVQLRELRLQEELRSYKAVMERDSFILVLIDGDGMIFDDKLIEKGEHGGSEAAGLLCNAVKEHVHQNLPNLPSDFKIVTRIYANLKELGDACKRSGILATAGTLENFARGFTGSKQLFDFIDVGMGEDRADDKISEIFKLHLYDCHCRHIFFGCSHDNGYARLLEDVADSAITKCITLLEGVPFEREFALLTSKYQTTRFEGLFRSTKMSSLQSKQYQLRPPQQTNGLPPPPIEYQSPYQPTIIRTPSASTYQATITRTPSASTMSSVPPDHTPSTWATTAMAAAALHLASPPPTPQPNSKTKAAPEVQRNRHGQRVDPVIQYDPNEVKRIKRMKMCNVYFLRDDCPYDPCTHDHHYKPTHGELQTLRYVSRMTPCKFDMQCDDARCIYGHRCPNDTEGKKDCRFGESCRFPREAHGIDRNVVKLSKVVGK